MKRQYHVVSSAALDVIDLEEPVLVYDSSEYDQLRKASPEVSK